MLVDIAEININSPYHVSLGEAEESLAFLTDHGIEYEISFIKDVGVFDGLVAYHFMLHPSNRPQFGHLHDRKIRETVFYILENFLSRDDKVVVYICDNMDSHQEYRNRLFNLWFKKANILFQEQFVMYSVSYSTYDISFYGGIILQPNHPRIDQYIEILNKSKQSFDEK